MNSEITLYEKIQDPMQAVAKMGDMFAASQMFGVNTPSQGSVLALACLAEKKSPTELMRIYHFIGGRMSMRSDAMLAGFRKLGGKVKWLRFDNEAAIGEWIFESNTLEIGFTIEDARRAGLVKKDSGWEKNPSANLRARCIAKAVRMLAPEVICGGDSSEDDSELEVKPSKSISLPIPAEVSSPVPVPQKETAAPIQAPATVEVVAEVEPVKPAEKTVVEKGFEDMKKAVSKLSDETVSKIEEIIGADAIAAVEYLVEVKKWIPKGGSLYDLEPQNAAQIIQSKDRFLAAVKKRAAGGVK